MIEAVLAQHGGFLWEARPEMMDAAIMRAVSEGNTLGLQMLFNIQFALDGARYSTVMRPEHFIAATQREDSACILLLLRNDANGAGVFPFGHKDVTQWANRAHEYANALGRHVCPCLLAKYVDYVQEKRTEKKEAQDFGDWTWGKTCPAQSHNTERFINSEEAKRRMSRRTSVSE